MNKTPDNITPIRPDINPSKDSNNWLSIRRHVTIGNRRIDLDPASLIALPFFVMAVVGVVTKDVPLDIAGAGIGYGILFLAHKTRERRDIK